MGTKLLHSTTSTVQRRSTTTSASINLGKHACWSAPSVPNPLVLTIVQQQPRKRLDEARGPLSNVQQQQEYAVRPSTTASGKKNLLGGVILTCCSGRS